MSQGPDEHGAKSRGTWQQVDLLYHDMLARPPQDRAAALVAACGDNATLYAEVESLLRESGSAAGFLDTPAIELTEHSWPVSPVGQIGHFVVEGVIGVGGMGEVYRARDTRLGREVAIKLLPDSVKNDRDRLARFEREARVLASLNHPNIAALHGVEDGDGGPALVMEFVDGETLEHRLERGPLALTEALVIADQIASAVQAAHECGIIHRDLKPGNIKLRPDGMVKVLDFGLAKAVAPIAADAPLTETADATREGMIMGTAAYMSPEQAEGKSVDRGTDTWAFGVVLMETLTGQPVFRGSSVSQVLAALLRDEPDWTQLPADVPAPIRRLLRRCLAKDRTQRLESAADARLEIADARTSTDRDAIEPQRTASKAARWPYVAVAALAVLGMGAMFAWRRADRAQPTPVYASLDMPADSVLGEDDPRVHLPIRPPMVFTSDGRSLIMQVARDGKPQLVLRSLDRPDARPIAGTDDARVPFVSPDGKWVGFSTRTELRKVPIDGGTPTTICPVTGNGGPLGATWGVGDVIVFSDVFSGRLMRVAAGGGTPEPVTPPPAPRHRFVTPFFLSDGKRFLFSDVSMLDASEVRLMMASVDGGAARVVLAAATDGRVLPSGRLAFVRLATLMTAGFDAASAQVTSDPVAAMSDVMQRGLSAVGANNTGAGMFAVSGRGDLAVVRGPVSGGEQSQLVWAARDGRSSAEPTSGAPSGTRLFMRMAPDRSRAIVTIVTPTRFELWFADWKRDVWTPCTDCNGDPWTPLLWSPDGRRLLMARHETLVSHAFDGSTPDQVLVREPDRPYLVPVAWLADGRIVYVSPPDTSMGQELKILNPGAAAGRVILPSRFGNNPEVSPDGRWLAYGSYQTNPRNVVVQALSGQGARTIVSAGDGDQPVWSGDGRTLYYLKRADSGETAVFEVSINVSGDGVTAGTPREVLRHPESQGCSPRCYDVVDGPRFLFSERSESVKRSSVTRIDLVLNWTATLPPNQ